MLEGDNCFKTIKMRLNKPIFSVVWHGQGRVANKHGRQPAQHHKS